MTICSVGRKLECVPAKPDLNVKVINRNSFLTAFRKVILNYMVKIMALYKSLQLGTSLRDTFNESYLTNYCV